MVRLVAISPPMLDRDYGQDEYQGHHDGGTDEIVHALCVGSRAHGKDENDKKEQSPVTEYLSHEKRITPAVVNCRSAFVKSLRIGTMKTFLAPPDYVDPVIEAYKKDVDRTLLRENLKLSVDERFRKFQELARLARELREAGERAHPRQSTK